MSNDLGNWHCKNGSPFGDDIGIYELADAIGQVLLNNKIAITFDEYGDALEIIVDGVGILL